MAAVLGRAPRHAVLLDTGLRVRVEDVKVGTALAVRAGELIPIDGVVTSGKSSVDQSTLTGESVPVEKEPDSTVWAGTMNLTGKFIDLQSSFQTTAKSPEANQISNLFSSASRLKLLSGLCFWESRLLVFKFIAHLNACPVPSLVGWVASTGYVSMKTSALSENSAVARMVKLVEEAQLARSRTEQMVERFAKYYTPGTSVASIMSTAFPTSIHSFILETLVTTYS